MTESIVVVGGGIVGLAAAYRLGERFPGARVTVLEKEPAVCRHQSGHNSGVLHAGLYYKPGSRKARLAVRGIRQMVEFCERHSIAHEVCGKVVVATTEEELPRLHALGVGSQELGVGSGSKRGAGACSRRIFEARLPPARSLRRSFVPRIVAISR